MLVRQFLVKQQEKKSRKEWELNLQIELFDVTVHFKDLFHISFFLPNPSLFDISRRRLKRWLALETSTCNAQA